MSARHQKIAILFVSSCLFCGLIIEVGARAILSLQVGNSIFMYGFGPDKDERSLASHENWAEGQYSKYFPHQVKTDTDVETGEQFQVEMNSRGFRGEDFSEEKPPGITRIITLGASSTFGYHSRDFQTYPHLLEQSLNAKCRERRFEVINLGIPHLDAKQILALFIAEGLPIEPDLVTFYEGINDSEGGAWRAPRRPSVAQRVKTFIRQKFVIALLLKNALSTEPSFTPTQIDEEIAGKAKGFFEGLHEIRRVALDNDVAFYVATQQAKSSLFEPTDIRGITYAEEVETIEEHLATDGTLAGAEKILLIHSKLMQGVQEWAAREGIPFIDVIHALDERRDTLVSWVHLSPEGNEIIADAFVERIAADWCAD